MKTITKILLLGLIFTISGGILLDMNIDETGGVVLILGAMMLIVADFVADEIDN